MAREAEFMRLQRAFTRHLRDPDHAAAPGDHEARRMAIYRHAIYANVAGLMADNYPRIRAILDDRRWQALVRDYIIRHRSRASAFIDVPREFIDYLEHERAAPDDPPFLLELAHFDWLETLVGGDTRRLDFSGIDRGGDLLAGVPVANPLLRTITYRFPVHAIDADYQPAEPPPRATVIAAFRDPDNRYGFLDLNPAAARLLEMVCADGGLSGEAIFAALAREMGRDDVQALAAGGLTILERMRERGAVIGTRAA